MNNSLFRKGLVICIICFLMLVSIPIGIGKTSNSYNTEKESNDSGIKFFLYMSWLNEMGWRLDWIQFYPRFLTVYYSNYYGDINVCSTKKSDNLLIANGKVQKFKGPVQIDFVVKGHEKFLVVHDSITGGARVFGDVDDIKITPLKEEKSDEETDASSVDYRNVGTKGPISSWLNIAEINLISGDITQIEKIERLLKSFSLHPMIYHACVFVKNLTFSVKYTKNIPSNDIFNRFSYSTAIREDKKVTFFNNSHEVIMKDFMGEFLLSHSEYLDGDWLIHHGYSGKSYRIPIFFGFDGYCENITIQ